MSHLKLAAEKYRTDGLLGLLRAAQRRAIPDPVVLRNRLKMLVPGDSVVENKGVSMDLETSALSERKRRQLLREDFGTSEEFIDRLCTYAKRWENDVIELGAGTGFMSCRLSSAMYGDLEYHAVEANPSIIPVTERVEELNECSFHIEHRAYAYDRSEVQLKIYESFNESTVKSGRGESKEVISVPAASLRELRDTFGLSNFVLYANMEGSEYELLDNEIELIREHCPWIVIGFHDFTSADTDDYFEALSDHFQLEWSTGSVPGTYVFRNLAFQR